MGRWTMDALQCRLNEMIMLLHQCNRARGWLQHWAQAEEVKPRAQERDPWLRIMGRHVQGLEHGTRQGVRMRVQPAWLRLMGLEGSAQVISRGMALLMGGERAG